MKNIILLFLLIPIHLFSNTHLSVGGTYCFGNDINIEHTGEIRISPTTENRAMLYITTTKKAPSYNTSVLLTEIEVIDNKAYFQYEHGDGTLVFEFFENSISVSDVHVIVSKHVFLDNKVFLKEDATIPKTYLRGNGKAVAIDKTAAEYFQNYYPNHSLWDFIGVWHYGQGAEALNISKGISSNAIQIQYNSSSDHFEDRFFENCYFKNGKIHGDFYGGKDNVIIEMEKGHLLLTIAPFHNFQPLKKQLFKRYPKSVFKYAIQKENATLRAGRNIVDSIVPGDRLLVGYTPTKKDYLPVMYYMSRFKGRPNFIKTTHNILPNQVADVKPLFISEKVHFKFFNNLNDSERFVKQIYTPEKLKAHLKVVNLPEQNSVGQKKLFIDKVTFTKLSLENIGQHKTEVFITGTVELSKKHRSIVVDFQSENEYDTYLVNYDLKGGYVDHILIGRNDYIESFTPITSLFSAGAVYVNAQIQDASTDGNGMAKPYYRTFETKRYVLNERGQFIASNHAKPYGHEQEATLKILSQQLTTKTEESTIHLYLGYIDTLNTGGYATTLFTKIEKQDGMEHTIPMDLTPVCGFYSLPYGDFSGPHGALQKVFYTNSYDGLQEGLRIQLSLKDINNDGIEELFMAVVDNSYTVAPKEYFCFVLEGGVWVYSAFNEKANAYIQKVDMPFETVIAAYYNTGFAPH